VPHRSPIRTYVPLLPLLAGIALSIGRFRADDPLGGLALGLGGMVLMVVAAIRTPPTK
jgi:hypothetical protein